MPAPVRSLGRWYQIGVGGHEVRELGEDGELVACADAVKGVADARHHSVIHARIVGELPMAAVFDLAGAEIEVGEQKGRWREFTWHQQGF